MQSVEVWSSPDLVPNVLLFKPSWVSLAGIPWITRWRTIAF
jgi:hypothetical protein